MARYLFLTTLLCVCLSTATTSKAGAQQIPSYTQYMFDRYLLNPAACGSAGYSTVGLLIKNQWSGFPGAPSSQSLNGQLRLNRYGLFGGGRDFRRHRGFRAENVGIGLSIYNDKRGALRTTGARMTYAYHIDNYDSQFSFGLELNCFQFAIDRNRLLTETNDGYLNTLHTNIFVPDASFGVQYSTEKLYGGLSITNLFQSFLMLGGRNSGSFRIERVYHAMGGYIFEAGNGWNIVPTVMVKFTPRPVVQADVNAMVYYYDRFWCGASYRTGNRGAAGGVCIQAGARYKKYCFTYAFDHSLTALQQYSFGSHEFCLSIAFGLKESFFRFKKRTTFKQHVPRGRNTT